MPSITLPVAIGATGALAAGAGLYGASQQANAAKSAATTQSDAALQAAQLQANASQQAVQAQTNMYQTTRADLAPYLQTGQGALSQLAKLWGINPGGSGMPDTAAMTTALQGTPGYQFGLDQGTQALDRSAASKGLLLSGGQLKDAQTFGQNYATANAWQPYVTELSSLAGLGENAGAQTGTAGTAAGGQIGSALTTGANNVAQSTLAAEQATAAGTVGGANAWTSGIKNALSNGTLSYFLNQRGGAPAGGYGVYAPSFGDSWANGPVI